MKSLRQLPISFISSPFSLNRLLSLPLSSTIILLISIIFTLFFEPFPSDELLQEIISSELMGEIIDFLFFSYLLQISLYLIV